MKIAAVPENLVERLATYVGMAPTPFIDTFHAVIVAKTIVVATKLGVFETVADNPRSASDIAELLGADGRALEKLLNVLVATGYLRFNDGCYAPTRLTRKWLLRDSPHSLHDNMLHRLLEWYAIDQTEAFVLTGTPLDAHDIIKGKQWDVYQRGMHALAKMSAGEVARRVPLPAGARAMLDIGGGHGAYSVAFSQRHPQLYATILDLPDAVTSAAPILAAQNMGERVVHRMGNALSEDLGEEEWDLIFISHLVHHFELDQNEELLRRAASALRPGGTVAILEVLRPQSPGASSQTSAILDLFFAITSNSGTWPRDQIVGWFSRAGLRPKKTISLLTAPDMTILTAVKPGDGAASAIASASR